MMKAYAIYVLIIGRMARSSWMVICSQEWIQMKWDTTYVPDENEHRRNDETLRNENIPQDEIDELLEEAEEFLNNNNANNDEEAGEYGENRSVVSIYEIREQQHLREEEEADEEPKMSDQIPMPNEAEKSEEQLNNEIVNIEKEIEEHTENPENIENVEV